MLKIFKLILFIILSISSIKAHSDSSSSSAGISTALFAGTVFAVTVSQQYNKPTVKKDEALKLAPKVARTNHTQLNLPQQSLDKNRSFPLLLTYKPEWHLANKINLDHLPSDYQYIEEDEDNNNENDENDYLEDLKYFLKKA